MPSHRAKLLFRHAFSQFSLLPARAKEKKDPHRQHLARSLPAAAAAAPTLYVVPDVSDKPVNVYDREELLRLVSDMTDSLEDSAGRHGYTGA